MITAKEAREASNGTETIEKMIEKAIRNREQFIEILGMNKDVEIDLMNAGYTVERIFDYSHRDHRISWREEDVE